MNKHGLFAPAFDALKAANLRSVRRPDATVATNQQVLDACTDFYSQSQAHVDAFTTAGVSFAQDRGSASTISQLQAQPWSNKSLTDGMSSGATTAASSGIFSKPLADVKASSLLTTVGFGVSLQGQIIVGGSGGAGVVMDVANRESPRGMAYGMVEIGLDIDLALNLEVQLFNQLPSQLTGEILGLAVEADCGLGVRLAVFTNGQLQFIGFAIGIGVGFGGGATVFGGHLWNFT